jgi:hypothetical protein
LRNSIVFILIRIMAETYEKAVPELAVC